MEEKRGYDIWIKTIDRSEVGAGEVYGFREMYFMVERIGKWCFEGCRIEIVSGEIECWEGFHTSEKRK